MEAEPLQDTLPPRHQIESDESEDEDAYTRTPGYTKQSPPSPVVHINWNNSEQIQLNLLVALCEAGRYWAQGVELGAVQGNVILNTMVIGKVYSPQWTDALVIVIDTRVPLYTMHAIASTITSITKPKSLSLIDSYPLPSYISTASHDSNPNIKPPIRYLQAHTKIRLPIAESFFPPNILQSLAAAFLQLAEFQNLPGTLLLLPSSHMTPPPPPTILSSTFGPPIREEWEPRVVEDLHRNLCTVLGSDCVWKVDNTFHNFENIRPTRKGDIGEGGMYL